MRICVTRCELPENFVPQYTKCIKTGSITEFVELRYFPHDIGVKRVSADYYIKDSDYNNPDLTDKVTQSIVDYKTIGKVDSTFLHPYEHSETKADETCQQSVKRSLVKLRRLINTNCIDYNKLHWITLTYAENMTDPAQLYQDFRKFWQRFKRYCKKQGYPVPEYITVVEPQGRGAWHCHCLFIWSIKCPFIDNNSVFAPMWGHGFTKIKGCDGKCDNIGAYFSAYLSDMTLEDYQQSEVSKSGQSFELVERAVTVDKDGQPVKQQSKKVVKGARLLLYPSGMRIFRTSRGVKQPEAEVLTRKQAEEEKKSAGCLTFQTTLSVEVVPEEGEQEEQKKRSPQVVHKEYYNRKRKGKKMEKERVTHCVDPCMKFCQCCEYGHVTVVDDGAFGEVLETFCIWGLEDDPPTDQEEADFAKWCNDSVAGRQLSLLC